MSDKMDSLEWEIRFSHLENNLLEINKTLVDQQNRIEFLERKNKLLSAKIQELSDQAEPQIPSRPPPHY